MLEGFLKVLFCIKRCVVCDLFWVGTIIDNQIVRLLGQMQVIFGIHVYHIDFFVQLLAEVYMPKEFQGHLNQLGRDFHAVNVLGIM